MKYFSKFSSFKCSYKTSIKSKIITQMIFGDVFSIAKKHKKWLKIKIKDDGYKGYIKNKNFLNFKTNP